EQLGGAEALAVGQQDRDRLAGIRLAVSVARAEREILQLGRVLIYRKRFGVGDAEIGRGLDWRVDADVDRQFLSAGDGEDTDDFTTLVEDRESERRFGRGAGSERGEPRGGIGNDGTRIRRLPGH